MLVIAEERPEPRTMIAVESGSRLDNIVTDFDRRHLVESGRCDGPSDALPVDRRAVPTQPRGEVELMIAAADFLLGHRHPVAMLVGCRGCKGAFVGQYRNVGTWRRSP